MPNSRLQKLNNNSSKKSTTRGRQKVEFEYMEDKVRRGVTFCKRKQGLLKKAMELNKLTGAQIVLIVLSENNQVHKYLSQDLRPLEETMLYANIKSLISKKQLGNSSGEGSSRVEAESIESRSRNVSQEQQMDHPANNLKNIKQRVDQSTLEISDPENEEEEDEEGEESIPENLDFIASRQKHSLPNNLKRPLHTESSYSRIESKKPMSSTTNDDKEMLEIQEHNKLRNEQADLLEQKKQLERAIQQHRNNQMTVYHRVDPYLDSAPNHSAIDNVVMAAVGSINQQPELHHLQAIGPSLIPPTIDTSNLCVQKLETIHTEPIHLKEVAPFRITLAKGSINSGITENRMKNIKIDAVVNPTNSNLSPAKGTNVWVPNSILFRENPNLTNACQQHFKKYGHLKLSEAIMTESFNIRHFDYIIHCVPPTNVNIRKERGASACQNKPDIADYRNFLIKTMKNCLNLANNNKLKTIAIPLLLEKGNFSKDEKPGPQANHVEHQRKTHIDALIHGATVWAVQMKEDKNSKHYLENVIFKLPDDLTVLKFKQGLKDLVAEHPQVKEIVDGEVLK